MSDLDASVSAGETGPVVRLAGQADLKSAAELGELLTTQVAGDARHLTVEVSGLSFMDSTAVRLLVMTAHVLNERGGTLTIAHPQPEVGKMLGLMGVDKLVVVRPPVNGPG
jgi:anti-sigma B factor antagonist